MNDYALILESSSTVYLNDHENLTEAAGTENISCSIMLIDYTNEDDEDFDHTPIEIGYLHLQYYNNDYADKYDINIYDAFDRYWQFRDLGQVLIDPKTDKLYHYIEKQLGMSFLFNYLVIEEIKIYSEYRGKGYGKEVIQGVMDQYLGKCGYVFLFSCPSQNWSKDHVKINDPKMNWHLFSQDEETAQAKLNRFFIECGFEELKEDPNFFGFNLIPTG